MSALPVPLSPLRYEPAVERIEADEAETTRELMRTMKSISETTFKHSGHATRSVHAKSHGLLQAEIEILGGLPGVLAQGLFAKSARYPVVMRFSTVPGDILPDSVSTPRGLAVKIIGVEGPRLPGGEDEVTQDFVLVNGPVFNSATAAGFLSKLKLLAGTTNKAEGLKKVVSAALRGVETVIESFAAPSPTITSMGGQLETHILGDTFCSQVPLRYGDYIAKIAIAPVSPELVALERAPLDLNTKPNALREAVIDFFARHGGVWELRVQLCTNLDEMPVEDAATLWPEDKSAYVAVARITAQPQIAWSAARSAIVDDTMAFNPWHCLADHKPLGSIMRARKAAYDMSAKFRAGRNDGIELREPMQFTPFADMGGAQSARGDGAEDPRFIVSETALDEALDESFPASDPPSMAQPSPSPIDRDRA